MISELVTIINPTGLHARPASDFCKMAKEMPCETYIEKNDKRVNAKSMISLLTLGVSEGDEIMVLTDGEGEGQALSQLVDFIRNIRD